MTLETEFHTELELRAIEWAELDGGRPMTNFRLPTGRIADIIYISKGGLITIIEVKTLLNASLMENAIKKYRLYCDYLYMGAPINEIQKVIYTNDTTSFGQATEALGLLEIGDRYVTKRREPRMKKLEERTRSYLTWNIKERRTICYNGLTADSPMGEYLAKETK